MTHVAFDTLKLARALRNEGKMSQQQAEGIAMALSETMREGLATRVDLQSVKDELSHKIDAIDEKLTHRIDTVEDKLTHRISMVEDKLTHKIESTEERLKAVIAETKADILKWVIGAVGFQTLVLIGSVRHWF